MPTITIEGKGDVTVDDSFLSLTPQQQQEVVDHIAGQKPATEDIGYAGAAAAGLRAGSTFNFSDELAGALAAATAGTPLPPEVASPLIAKAFGVSTGVARMLFEKVTGVDTGATKAYQEASAKERQTQKTAEEQYPGTHLVGQLGGALAVPVPGIAAAKGLPLATKMLRGYETGVAAGALSGIGGGEDLASRATGGVVGGLVGGGLGAAVPLAATGVGMAGRGIYNKVTGIVNPENVATQKIIGQTGKDVAGSTAGLSQREYDAAIAQGLPVALAEQGGTNLGNLVRAATNISPEAHAIVEGFAKQRFDGQAARASKFVSDIVGSEVDIGAKRMDIDAAARKANGPAYKAAYEVGDRPTWSPELERLTASPDVQSAMHAAETRWKANQVADGFGAMNPPVKVDVDRGGFVRWTGSGGIPTFPNIQYWDYVQRALSDAVRGATPGTDTYRVMSTTLNQLKTALDNEVPAFAEARSTARMFFGEKSALDLGKKFLDIPSKTMDMNDARRVVGKFTDEQKADFKYAIVGSMLNKIAGVGYKRDVAAAIEKSPLITQRLELALGPDKAKLDTYIHVETAMNNIRQWLGGSTTARQLAQFGMVSPGTATQLGAAGAVEAYGRATHDPLSEAKAMLVLGLTRGARSIDQRVAKKIAEMVTSQDPAILNKGIEAIARSNAVKNKIRDLAIRGFTVPLSQIGSNAAN